MRRLSTCGGAAVLLAAVLLTPPAFAATAAEITRMCRIAKSAESDVTDTLSKIVAIRLVVGDGGIRACQAKTDCRAAMSTARRNVNAMITHADDPVIAQIDEVCGTSVATLTKALRADSRWMFR